MFGARINPIKTALIAAFLMGFGVSTHAQGLRPLTLEMEADAELPYILDRCGGLYLSTLEWVGEDRMGPEQTETYKNLGLLFISSAINAQGETPDDMQGAVQQQVLASMREFADLYIFRYKTLLTTSGIEITEDGLWNSDLETCAVIANGSDDG